MLIFEPANRAEVDLQQLDLDPMLNAELNAIKMLRERGKL